MHRFSLSLVAALGAGGVLAACGESPKDTAATAPAATDPAAFNPTPEQRAASARFHKSSGIETGTTKGF